MGDLAARDMAAVGEDLGVSLEQQIGWHLQCNHFPPAPERMVPVCIEAIRLGNLGNWDKEIQLPEGVSFRGRNTTPVSTIVEQLHLDAWIDPWEEAWQE